jgi:hypothetical protein
VVHVIGPGFGESQIVLLPSGHCIVIDCCTDGGKNLTLELLRELRIPHIDLLVITHPDLDHLRGIPSLTRACPPKLVWRFPFGGLRELVSGWCRLNPNDERLQVADDAFRTLEELEERNVAWDAGLSTATWRPDTSIEVRCLAPTSHDQRHAHDQLFQVVQYLTGSGLKERPHDEPTLNARILKYLHGEGTLGDRPNGISLAIGVQWQTRRLLFCGDVENGRASEYSGWKGILRVLEQDKRRDWVEEVDFIKVAHHGSNGAFHLPAWQIHRRSDGRTVAAITPFDRSTPPLPREEVLTSLSAHAERLCITEDARGAFALAEKAGWVRSWASPYAALGPHLSVVLAESGAIDVHAGPRAGVFCRP